MQKHFHIEPVFWAIAMCILSPSLLRGQGSYGFGGETFDSQAGPVYLRGRYYDPVTHSFVT